MQTARDIETFAFYVLEQGEPMSPVESELNAIDRVEQIKEYHCKAGIQKSPRYYHYFKLQTMALNDGGYKRTKEHIFKDNKGKIIKTILN